MSPLLIVLESNVHRRQNIKQSLNLILITNKYILHIYYRHLGFLKCVLWISTKCEQVSPKIRDVDRNGNFFALHCGKSIIKINKDHVEENLKRKRTWQELSDNNNHRLQEGTWHINKELSRHSIICRIITFLLFMWKRR